MADGDRRKDSRKIDDSNLEETKTEELMETLVELNHSVSNISKLILQIQRNIAKDTAKPVDAVSARTLH